MADAVKKTVSGNPLRADFGSVTKTSGSTDKDEKVGGGSLDHSSPVPPGQGDGGEDSAIGFAAMLSLVKMLPAIKGSDQEVMLAEVALAIRDTANKTGNADVETKSDQAKQREADDLKKLQDAEKKLEDIINLQKSGNILDKIKLAFEILGAAIATVFAGILAVVTFGAATGVSAMIVAGAVMGVIGAVAGDVMAVNDAVKEETGLGIAGNIDKLVHPNDPSSWSKADMGFMMGLMGAALVSMIAAALMSGGTETAGVVNSVTDAVEEMPAMLEQAGALVDDEEELAGLDGVGSEAEEISTATEANKSSAFEEDSNLEDLSEDDDVQDPAAEAKKKPEMTPEQKELFDRYVAQTKSIKKTQNIVDLVTGIINSSTNVASSGINMAVADQKKEKDDTDADEKGIKALEDMANKMVDLAIKMLKRELDAASSEVQGSLDAMKETASTLSHFRFAG